MRIQRLNVVGDLDYIYINGLFSYFEILNNRTNTQELNYNFEIYYSDVNCIYSYTSVELLLWS